MIEPIKMHDINQMSWAAFHWNGRTDLVDMQRDDAAPRGGYSSGSYLTILQEHLPTVYDPSLIFMQDNAPIHAADIITNWFIAMGIQTLNWPAISPDLNPIEHLWKRLKEKTHELHPELEGQGNTEQARENLIQAAHEAWNSIGRREMQRLIRSMRRRIQAVIDARGWYTKY